MTVAEHVVVTTTAGRLRGGRDVMRFDEDSTVVDDPDAPKVALWKGIYPNLIG